MVVILVICNLLMFVYIQFSILVSLLFNLWIAIFSKPTYLLVRIQLRQTCDCFSIAFQSNSLEIDRLSRIWLLTFDFDWQTHLLHWSASLYSGGNHCVAHSQQQQQSFYGPLSGTTRVSRYQKKHSSTILIIIQSLSASSIYYDP